MTWKNRWPTAEEAKAHADRYGRRDIGAWLYRPSATSGPNHVFWIEYRNGIAWTAEATNGMSVANPCEDMTYTPWLRPISFGGRSVPWPGEETKLERRLSDLENWYKLTKAAGGGPDHYRAGDLLELARDLLAEAKGWEQQTSEVIDQANEWKRKLDAAQAKDGR